jgi:ABC-type nitrate/sulfonate/bicarbonate transport system substrate-binding protein
MFARSSRAPHPIWLISLLIFAAVLLTAVAAAARTTVSQVSKAGAKDRPKITIDTGIDAGYAPYYVAVAKGFLKAQGINATFIVFNSGPLAETALIGGQGDVTQNAELPQQKPMSLGADIHVVASSYHPTKNMCVMATKDITSPSDLNGKSVTYVQLSGGQYLWSVWSKKHKLTNVKNVYLQPPDMLPAMARGDVQAAVIWQPWCDQISAVVPGGHILAWPGADEHLYQPDNAVIFNGRLAKQDPALGRRVLKALINSANWINQNPAAAAKIVGAIIHQSPAAAESQLRGLLPFRMRFYQVAAWAKYQKLVTYDQNAQQLMNTLLNPCLLKRVDPTRVKLVTYKRQFKC